MDLADDLVTWLQSKIIVLALISDACSILEENIPSSVICAVITRWTTHYLAYDWLITLCPVLMVVVTNNTAQMVSRMGSRIITGNASAKQKATRMIELIKSGPF